MVVVVQNAAWESATGCVPDRRHDRGRRSWRCRIYSQNKINIIILFYNAGIQDININIGVERSFILTEESCVFVHD